MQITEQLANLSPEERRALLEQLLRQKAQGPKLAPLSFAQERILFFEQLIPGSTSNLMSVIRFTSRINQAALEQSLTEVVRRHETLRTTFTTTDGQPMQVIAPPGPLPLSVVDLRYLPVAARKTEVQRLAKAEAQYHPALTQGPLFRARLLRVSDEEHALLLNIHHIISDGWSIGVLVREVLTLYRAFSTGTQSPLTDLPIQYADFVRWQREKLQGQALEAQLAYWRQQLRGMPAALTLPTDRPRALAQAFRGARQSLKLSRPLSASLKILSQQEEATLFMTALAAFQVLLYRYTGQQDISVGTFIANRSFSEMEGLIGLLIDPLVLRTDLSGDPTFRQLLKRVRQVTLEALAHRDLPFEELLKELQPTRDLSRTPLFQVMLIFRDMPSSTMEAELPDLSVQELEEDEYANSDVALFLWETDQELVGFMEYNADLFDATTITQMLGHWQVLLQGIVTHPDERLSDLPLLTEAERAQLLEQWSHLGSDYAQAMCVHDLFQQQVSKTPSKVSIVREREKLTFQQLNEQADQLAHLLRKLTND